MVFFSEGHDFVMSADNFVRLAPHLDFFGELESSETSKPFHGSRKNPGTDGTWTTFHHFFFFLFCSVYICSRKSLVVFHNMVNVIRKCLETEQVFITILLLLLLLGAAWCENFTGGFMKIVSLCYCT